jgi:hypothetical protein
VSEILSNGTNVRTTQDAKLGGWNDPTRPNCKWGVKGSIISHETGHGLCYKVQHGDGTIASYDHEELVVEECDRSEDECKECGVVGQVNGMSCTCPQCGRIIWGI